MTLYGSNTRPIYYGPNTKYGDVTGPTLDITSTAFTSPGVINTTPTSFTATFSEPTLDFVIGDISVSNGGSVSNFVPVSGTVYTFDVTATPGAVVVSIATGAGWDHSGNDTVADSYSYTYDTGFPSVVLSNTTVADDGYTASFTSDFTATFSETVTGFVSADLTLVNCTISAFTPVSGTVYTFTATRVAPGQVSVQVPASVAQDLSSNFNTISNLYNYGVTVIVIDETNSTIESGSATWGDGATLDLTVPATVESGATLILNLTDLSQLTGSGSITIAPGGTVVINGYSQTVKIGTLLVIRPQP